MIKASGRTGLGQPLLILGLSGENVARLAAGEPIKISTAHLAQLGLPGTMEIVIHYGKTEQAILDEFAEHGLVNRDAADAAKRAMGDLDRCRSSGTARASRSPPSRPTSCSGTSLTSS
jgi:hypothetical protein